MYFSDFMFERTLRMETSKRVSSLEEKLLNLQRISDDRLRTIELLQGDINHLQTRIRSLEASDIGPAVAIFAAFFATLIYQGAQAK